MKSLLCDVIAAPTMAELRARRDAALAGPFAPDLVELRLDTVDRPDVAGALQGRRGPVIVTCRAAWEGGHFAGPEEERQRVLREALAAGAEFVDVEWRTEGADRWLRPEDRPRVVRSLHDFDRMPADVAGIIREMRRTGAGVVKIAGRASTLRDLLSLLDAGRAQGSSASDASDARTVLIGMGMPGVASRILAAHFRSCWTYAGPAIAPGQIEAGRLIEEFRFRSLSEQTRVYAVVGQPIAHSISPAMHNAAFAALGLDAVYIPCEAADIDDFLALADALPIAGASVTAPFKIAAAERSTPTDDEVRRIGAANTLRRADAGWESRNTDVAGFLAPLDDRIALHGARAAILGTGGAARAVVAGLGAAGAVVTVHARNTAAAADVASLAGGTVRDWTVPPGSWDLLVNTTPIGTFPRVDETPYAGPFGAADAAAARAGRAVVYDLVYNPRPTRLLRDAAAAGCATLDGLDMLVEQAARQFTWWTGEPAPIDVMRAAAERRLTQMAADTAVPEPAGSPNSPLAPFASSQAKGERGAGG